MKTFRWGILATGHIANSMAQALQSVAEAEIVAVASRSQETADAFGDKWHIPRRYASYEALAADPDVEIIYIATPHPFHFDNMQLCLNAGKHVLCEKPLTLNAHEAKACIGLARQKQLFLMEAIWMRFFPAIAQVRQWVANGTIGEVRLIQADFCFHLPYNPKHRLYNPDLGGGALLDLGIYPLSFTIMLLGFPKEVQGWAQLSQTGVDELNALTLHYEDGVIAQLTSSMSIYKPREAFVVGTRGYIKVHDIFFCPDRLTLHLNGQEPQTMEVPFLENGYPHEIEEVHACLRAGKIESPLLPHDETMQMMQLMDTLRQQWEIRYPGERLP